MAAPRLPFLWPMLARGFEATSPPLRSARAVASIRAYHGTARRPQGDAIQQRYGTANEPLAHLGSEKPKRSNTKRRNAESKASSKGVDPSQPDAEPDQASSTNTKKQQSISESTSSTPQTGSADSETMKLSSDPAKPTPQNDDPPKNASAQNTATPTKVTESILDQVPDPGTLAKEKAGTSAKAKTTSDTSEPATRGETVVDESTQTPKAPHITTPPYVHHFDTYGLVRRLEDSGWSNPQAVTIMKAVRLMLADNMELARDALVSKSQVENETYLFRAACAELKTEVMARRKSEQEKMRTERNQLQHELDILTQTLGQESAAMKDEVKGMFDDRKMAVRNEQRIMESKIQRLNYQITVELQADGKSDVEGLRWVMTRRVIIALGVVVIMVLSSLKLYSNTVHEQEMEAKRKANSKSSGSQTDGPGFGDGSQRDPRMLGGGGEMLVKEGDNPAFVSLG